MIHEVSPPGWGHTKAEKEKTKPNKPKSKIGGTADAMKKAQERGDIPKNMNIFALMWSMKNKGDKPHYKPGVKDVLKKKYQKEEKADEKPYPPTRLFKNVPNSVVKKANKEADKVKREQEKAVLGEPPKNGPSGATMHSKDNVYEDEKVDMVSAVAKAIQMKEFGLPPHTVGDKDLGDKINKAHEKEQKRRAKIDAKNIKVHGKLPYKKEEVENESRSSNPGMAKQWQKSYQKKGSKEVPAGTLITPQARKAAKLKIPPHPDPALTKQRRGEEVETEGWGAVAKTADALQAKSKAREDKARNKKVSTWAKGRKEEVTHFGDILRQAIEEAKKVDAIKEINKIVKTKTMGKLHGQKVDLFTASAIQQVYKAINHKNKEKMNSVMSKDIHGLLKMADFSMSKMKR